MPMPSTKKKPVPEFKSEDQEREFWAKNDSTEFIDWQSGQRCEFPSQRKDTTHRLGLCETPSSAASGVPRRANGEE